MSQKHLVNPELWLISKLYEWRLAMSSIHWGIDKVPSEWKSHQSECGHNKIIIIRL